MVTWFEKSKEIILSRGNSKDEAVLNMIEDLFDLLMVKITLIHLCYKACVYLKTICVLYALSLKVTNSLVCDLVKLVYSDCV